MLVTFLHLLCISRVHFGVLDRLGVQTVKLVVVLIIMQVSISVHVCMLAMYIVMALDLPRRAQQYLRAVLAWLE